MNYESESFRNGTKVEGAIRHYFNVGHNNFELVLDNWQRFSFVLRLSRNAEFKQQYICISICYNHAGTIVLWLSSPWHNIRSKAFSVNKNENQPSLRQDLLKHDFHREVAHE